MPEVFLKYCCTFLTIKRSLVLTMNVQVWDARETLVSSCKAHLEDIDHQGQEVAEEEHGHHTEEHRGQALLPSLRPAKRRITTQYKHFHIIAVNYVEMISTATCRKSTPLHSQSLIILKLTL